MFRFLTHTFFSKDKTTLILLSVLILSTFLRFYKVPELFVFTADEEYAVTLALPVVKDFHIIWIGENAADTGFYMGPFWVYFTAFWLYISKSNPLILAYVVSGIGVITTLVMFLVAKSMFSLKTAAITGLLYAILPLRVYYDRKFWLLNPAPLLAVLLLFTLYKSRKQQLWWPVVAFLFGMVLHIHLSLLSLGAVISYWIWQQRKTFSKKIIIASLVALFIPLSPLIAFDYFHKGSNITTPLRLLGDTSSQKREFDIGEHFGFLYQSLGRIWYLYPERSNSDEVLFACHPFGINKLSLTPGINTTASQAFPLLALFSLGLIVWFLKRSLTWKMENNKILALFLMILLAGFIFYPGKVMEYYLSTTFSLLLFIPGIFYSSLKGSVKYLFLIFLLIISALSIFTVLSATPEYGMVAKINLVKKTVSYIGQEKFELRESGGCHDYGGWRIIFRSFGKLPERSSADRSLGYLYPEEISGKQAKYEIIMSEKRVPLKYNPQNTEVISEGGFQALIIKMF